MQLCRADAVLYWIYTHHISSQATKGLCEQAASTADIQYSESSKWFPWMTCSVHIQQIIPYERHPQVIHGMKSAKFSLFIPPLAGQ